MPTITTCPSCHRQNRVPTSARGTPRCAVCGSSLAWIVSADDATFDAAVDSRLPVLVDLWAPWCGPCRLVAPVLEKVAADRAGRVKVVKVNVDEAPQVSARFDVQSIPTLLLLRDGAVVDAKVGALPGPVLSAWLDGHLTGAA